MIIVNQDKTSNAGASWSNDGLIDEALSIRDFVLIDDYHPEIRAIMSESTDEYSGIHKVWVAGIGDYRKSTC